jgi:hypothetical protein
VVIVTDKRRNYLTTLKMARLNQACVPVREALATPYLVGTVLTSPDYRDVDVRVMLDDDEFDAIFMGRPLLWSWLCQATCAYLADATDLPIDFQVQRRSHANARYSGPRSPLGRRERLYAGGGDATPDLVDLEPTAALAVARAVNGEPG